jgi:hypothetical protein
MAKKKQKKKETTAPAAQSGTTTGDVADFQHRLFGPYIRRKKPKDIEEEEVEVDESNDRKQFRLGPWTFGEPTAYDHPLNDGEGSLSSDAAPKIADDEDEGDYKERERLIKKLTADRNKEADKGKNESTTSGQALGSPSSGAVAGTDTRFGAPSFEPNYFEKKVDAIKNEKTFYDTTNQAVLLPGFEYVDDYAKRTDKEFHTRNLSNVRFSDNEKNFEEVPQVADDNLGDDAAAEIKKTGVDWSLDMKTRNYRDLLKRLKKAHNI